MLLFDSQEDHQFSDPSMGGPAAVESCTIALLVPLSAEVSSVCGNMDEFPRRFCAVTPAVDRTSMASHITNIILMKGGGVLLMSDELLSVQARAKMYCLLAVLVSLELSGTLLLSWFRVSTELTSPCGIESLSALTATDNVQLIQCLG